MRFMIIIGLLLSLGCSSKIRNASDDCQRYFVFLEQNWQVNDTEKLIYGFKDNPEYWKDDKYMKSDCFVGLTKKQINKLLGKPSKSFAFYDFEMVYYCFSEGCLRALKPGGKELVINYDNNGVVTLAYFNPVGVDSSH